MPTDATLLDRRAPDGEARAAIAFVPVRRQDRAVTDEAWIERLLAQAPLGVMATAEEGEPYLNANLFVYDATQKVIYLHTARSGRTRRMIGEATRVAFSVHEMGRLLPAPFALEMSVEYAGVVVFGEAALVEDAAEAEYGLQLLLDKYFPHLHPGRDYQAIQPAELARTSVFRIRIEAWSGKQKQAPADFAGAFWYET
jgi:nitroimidazol reductase NimA-like FMN-containing flavoprotein (pyridoxamine 5'-phosphate oxidase superfamily)